MVEISDLIEGETYDVNVLAESNGRREGILFPQKHDPKMIYICFSRRHQAHQKNHPKN